MSGAPVEIGDIFEVLYDHPSGQWLIAEELTSNGPILRYIGTENTTAPQTRMARLSTKNIRYVPTDEVPGEVWAMLLTGETSI